MTSVMEANAEALFTNRSLEEIREVEVRTRREANEKAEAVRWDSRRASEFVRARSCAARAWVGGLTRRDVARVTMHLAPIGNFWESRIRTPSRRSRRCE